MAEFCIRFFFCNLFICALLPVFLTAKRMLNKCLDGRMRLRLWFPLLGLLAVPFLPLPLGGFPQIFPWLTRFKSAAGNTKAAAGPAASEAASHTWRQMHDLAQSVSARTPSAVGRTLFLIWLAGMLAALFSLMKSSARFNIIKKSALPLQNRDIRMLYADCLKKLRIRRDIPLYSTAFLKSPVIAGLFRPCIYLPLHLISDVSSGTGTLRPIRFILLHELTHYRHRDALNGCLMNLSGVLYWFNPLVLHALEEMRSDREIACDAAVLELLDESDYRAYGSTLIDFAEKISHMPAPFTAGISGSMRQLKKRIAHISSYKKPTLRSKVRGAAVFCIFAALLFRVSPALSTYGARQDDYRWDISDTKITLLSDDASMPQNEPAAPAVDLSPYFKGYEGSFVLYDRKNDRWSVYNQRRATLRTSPDSTYKIYGALFGLEEGLIAPGDSLLPWDGTDYPFQAWEKDHDLDSAMRDSVNWYFQDIDERLGASTLRRYLARIGYGNERIHADPGPFWLQSALKISPVEQVLLLRDLCENRPGFAPENIDAVKASICLFSSECMHLYGKTGTGRVDGQDVNGWFIGFLETDGNTFFFATNIQGADGADGRRASEITWAALEALELSVKPSFARSF